MQDLWQAYFDGKHEHVLAECQTRLFESHAPDQLHISGLSMLATGNVVEGISRMRSSLVLYAASPNWFANAAIASQNANASQEALSFAEEGLLRFPNDASLNYCMGNSLTGLNRHADALPYYDRALAIAPDMVDAMLNRGNSLRRTDRSDDALAAYEQVLAVDPGHHPAMINRIGVLIEKGRSAEADPLLTGLVERGGVIPEAVFMLAMLRLQNGDYADGFRLYHSRWACAMSEADRKAIVAPMPQTLDEIAGKHVLVSHEQGFGDSLQFARFIPEITKHCARVTILCPNPLTRLFKASFAGLDVVEERPAKSTYDMELPMLDMPMLLGTTLDTLTGQSHPYLTVPNDVLEARRLPPCKAKLRVGLVWAGQCREHPDLAAVDRRRSMTLDQLAPLASVPDVEFISLQMGEPSTQGNTPPAGMVLLPGVRTGYDFLDTAALMQQLDLLITVDTAPLHLAAGLGVTTWVLSRFDSCWRWLRDRTDSPWYPSVSLFIQPEAGDWTTPVAALTERLREVAA